eukprot:5401574-Lingulodinium_polyedra.AAC.1
MARRRKWQGQTWARERACLRAVKRVRRGAFRPPRASRAFTLAFFHGFNALKGMRIFVSCAC